MQTVRIFISSPGDVAEERDRARQVVESLRRRYSGRFYLKPVLWEDLPLQADMSFQHGIDLVLSKEHGIDVAVFILWSRLGSPLGPLVKKDCGGEYRSGTERELDMMLKARAQSGGEGSAAGAGSRARPALMVYARRDDPSFDERLRGKPATEQRSLVAQKELVEKFIAEEFHDGGSGGHNVRAYHSFDRPVTFAQRLRAHLTELLDEMAGGGLTECVWDIEKQGPPFQGLEAFQPRHADVFFGRETETLEARHALRQQARNGCAFLLLSGASGSGKSSLARAGVLPAIVENELDDQVTTWRKVIATPLELGHDPLRGLVRRLAADDVLPELRGESEGLEELIEGLRKDPALTLRLRLKDACARAARRAGGGLRVLVLLDQLEELFASAAVTDNTRQEFLEALDALARSGYVWLLATVRSDFSAQVQAQPALVRLMEGRGSMPVLPPEADALRRLIEEPARLAGLTFEVRDVQSLADRILRDAAEHAELLPLLEYVLRELFEQRTARRELRWAVYENLGGVEGALAKRAEDVFRELSADAQMSLGRVLNALVTIGQEGREGAGEQLVRRRGAMRAFEQQPSAQALINAFIKERLLTTSEDSASGVAIVAVTHESLLRVWPRAVTWAEENRGFLITRARLVTRMREGSPLLEGDPLLDAAKIWLGRDEAEGLDDEQREFVESSVQRIEAARSHREKTRLYVLVGLAVLSAFAIAAAVVAGVQKSEAVKQQGLAREQTALAKAALADASEKLEMSQLEEGRAWLERAKAALNGGDNLTAIMLAGRAVGFVGYGRKSQETPEFEKRFPPLLGKKMKNPAAEKARLVGFNEASSFVKDIAPTCLPLWSGLLTTDDQSTVNCVAFSPDGTRLASGSKDKTIKLWDAASGKELHTLQGHLGPVGSVAFSPDGTCLASGSEDNTLKLWDTATGRELTTLKGHLSRVASVAFSPDGKRIASGSGDNTIKLWDVASGNELATLQNHLSGVTSVAFSPDGTRLVSGSNDKTIRLWELAGSKELATLQSHADAISSVAFSPDGTRLASASEDKTLKLWDAANGKELATLHNHLQGLTSVAFSPDGTRLASASYYKVKLWDVATGGELNTLDVGAAVVTSVAFSPDGTRLVCGFSHKGIELWDCATGHELATLRGHLSWVTSAAFSPDGTQLASGSNDKTIKLWDVATGRELATLKGHLGPVNCVAFSADGTRLASGSDDKTIKLWDAATGKELATLQSRVGRVTSVGFSPDGTHLAGGSSPGMTLERYEATNLPFSQSDTNLTPGLDDESLELWDAVSVKELAKPQAAEVEAVRKWLGPSDFPLRTNGTVAAAITERDVYLCQMSPLPLDLTQWLRLGLLTIEDRSVRAPSIAHSLYANIGATMLSLRQDTLGKLGDPTLSSQARAELHMRLCAEANQPRAAAAQWRRFQKDPVLNTGVDSTLRRVYLGALLYAAKQSLLKKDPYGGDLLEEIKDAMTPKALAAPNISLASLSLLTLDIPDFDDGIIVKRQALRNTLVQMASPVWKKALAGYSLKQKQKAEVKPKAEPNSEIPANPKP